MDTNIRVPYSPAFVEKSSIFSGICRKMGDNNGYNEERKMEWIPPDLLNRIQPFIDEDGYKTYKLIYQQDRDLLQDILRRAGYVSQWYDGDTSLIVFHKDEEQEPENQVLLAVIKIPDADRLVLYAEGPGDLVRHIMKRESPESVVSQFFQQMRNIAIPNRGAAAPAVAAGAAAPAPALQGPPAVPSAAGPFIQGPAGNQGGGKRRRRATRRYKKEKTRKARKTRLRRHRK
jgi:hypothetical protein